MSRPYPLMVMLLLPASIMAFSAQPRVFYSPAERAAITADRKKLSQELMAGTGQQAAAATPPAPASESAPVAAAPVASRLDGISLARDGKAYAWISGQRYLDGSSFGGRRLQVSANGIRLQGNPSRLIRVGEAIP